MKNQQKFILPIDRCENNSGLKLDHPFKCSQENLPLQLRLDIKNISGPRAGSFLAQLFLAWVVIVSMTVAQYALFKRIDLCPSRSPLSGSSWYPESFCGPYQKSLCLSLESTPN